jgi:diguanylate cyclase (GGDEF)-like protein
MMLTTGVQSLIAAPLHLDGDVLGVFVCFFHHPRQFDEEATPLAEALAGQAAQALTSLRLQLRLEYAATHDETTGLPNRRRLESGLAGFDHGGRLAVLFIDLDGFKSVNDYVGHQQGDAVLREAARRLQSTVREGDIVIRYGGDEFVVICEVRDDVPVGDLADRIRDVLRSPYPGVPTGLSISASIGVATTAIEEVSGSIDRVIRLADQAMYVAKVGGGNQVVDG